MSNDEVQHSSRRRSSLAAVVVAGVLFFVALVSASCGSVADDRAFVVGAAAGQISTTTTSAPPAPTTTTSIAVMPVPEPLPAMAFAETPEVVLGTLEIPALSIEADLQEGMTLTAINRGPSHWPGTALPGRMGNVVVAGHRTTYSRPFERLDELVEGDLVHFRLSDGTEATYEVRDVIVVPEAALGIATQTTAHTATLFACHPKGSATHRIVAKLRLLDEHGVPVDDEDDLPPIDVGLREGDDVLLVRETDEPLIVHDPFGSLEQN